VINLTVNNLVINLTVVIKHLN